MTALDTRPVTAARLLPAPGDRPADTWSAHRNRHGDVPYQGRALIGLVDAAGLTGRGGAAFPTARKLAAVAAGAGTPVVVGNGAEGEPASGKDQTLLRLAPHLVLDGLQLVADSLGARDAYLYVRRDDELLHRLRAALAERAAADRVSVRLVDAPHRFVSGEESAVVHRIEGGPAIPRFRPKRVYEQGVGGAPTLVQNVETLAHLALIARYGPGWFRGLGTAEEPGTMLTTVHRADGTRSVVEVGIGTSLASVLGLPSGLDARRPAAAGVLVGGYHGGWLPAAAAAHLPLTSAALRPYGLTPGAGVLAALPAGRCGLVETAHLTAYLAGESTRQCGPCLNGLPRIAGAMTELARPRPRPGVRADLERWAGLMPRRGACHHPDGTVRLVRSALLAFADELRLHEAGACLAVDFTPFLPLGGAR